MRKMVKKILPIYTFSFHDRLLQKPIVDVSISPDKGHSYVVCMNDAGIVLVLERINS